MDLTTVSKDNGDGGDKPQRLNENIDAGGDIVKGTNGDVNVRENGESHADKSTKGATTTTEEATTEQQQQQKQQSTQNDKTKPASTTTAGGVKNETRDSRNTSHDTYSLAVKAEYLLTERPASLGPLPEAATTNGDSRSNNNDQNGNNNDKKKKKRNRGMNKKRPRDAHVPDSEKLCLSVVREESCPYELTCKFSHDVQTFLKTKPPDLGTYLQTNSNDGNDNTDSGGGGCPIYQLYGFCKYGVTCRYSASHTTKDGRNLRKDPAPPLPAETQNVTDKDLLLKLRKNQYSFVCPRAGKKYKNKTNQDPSEHWKTPVAGKERKLIDFSNKVYVAPLTTVGNLPFRRIMKQFGADITCGEMAVTTCLLEGKASEWALLKRHPSEDIFGVQLAGGYPDQFARIGQLIHEQNSNSNDFAIDFVDVNLGCPLDLICQKGAGAGLMIRERRLRDCAVALTNQLTEIPVTIKMRTGWDTEKPFAHKLLPTIQSWGVPLNAIMLHGRSRLQRYAKHANWDYIQQAANSQTEEHPRLPVIGNGDILSYTDYEEKVEQHEGVLPTAMIGRGALIKPWLPTEIKERRHWDISANERFDILRDFVKFGLEHWGSDQKGVNLTRRFLLEWLSFLHRYVPVGLLERAPQQFNQRPPNYIQGRSDLETLMMSKYCHDWIKISEMLLGPVPEGFQFEPKHKANSYK